MSKSKEFNMVLVRVQNAPHVECFTVMTESEYWRWIDDVRTFPHSYTVKALIANDFYTSVEAFGITEKKARSMNEMFDLPFGKGKQVFSKDISINPLTKNRGNT